MQRLPTHRTNWAAGENSGFVMKSSRIITLFSDRPDPFVSGSSFAVSILMHGAAIGVVALAILYGPQNQRIITERFVVRRLELYTPELQGARFCRDSISGSATQGQDACPRRKANRAGGSQGNCARHAGRTDAGAAED